MRSSQMVPSKPVTPASASDRASTSRGGPTSSAPSSCGTRCARPGRPSSTRTGSGEDCRSAIRLARTPAIPAGGRPVRSESTEQRISNAGIGELLRDPCSRREGRSPRWRSAPVDAPEAHHHPRLRHRRRRDPPRAGIELAPPELRRHRGLPVRRDLDAPGRAVVRHQREVVGERRLPEQEHRWKEVRRASSPVPRPRRAVSERRPSGKPFVVGSTRASRPGSRAGRSAIIRPRSAAGRGGSPRAAHRAGERPPRSRRPADWRSGP